MDAAWGDYEGREEREGQGKVDVASRRVTGDIPAIAIDEIEKNADFLPLGETFTPAVL